jgi:signal transduction histidine kinase
MRTNNLKVLVVDDDLEWAKPFCENLEKIISAGHLSGANYDGYIFRYVTNQKDANRAVDEQTGEAFNLILLDLNYPLDDSVPIPIDRDTTKPLQGIHWLPELRRKQPKAAIVIVTSYPYEEDLKHVVAAIKSHRANDFVPKAATTRKSDIVNRIYLAIQNERQRQRLLLLEKEWPLLGGIRAAKVIEEDVSDLCAKQRQRMDRIAQRIASGDSSSIAAAPRIIQTEISADKKELDELIAMVDRRLSPGERKKESVNLVELIQDILLLYAPRLDEAGARAEGPDPRTKAEVSTFVGDLKTALHEVVTNAIESLACSARPKAERVANISIVHQAENPVIQVEDNGDGFSAEAIANLYKLGKTTRNPREHVGMGLYVARRAMIAIGGDMRAENRPDGVRPKP